MSKRVYLTKEELLRRLILQTPAEIAWQEGMNRGTVLRWIKKYKIKGHVAISNFHTTLTRKKLEELLQRPEFSFLSESQKARATHLVNVHDKINELKDPDELILMEADTLGALDVTLVTPSFDVESNDKWMRGVI